MDYIITDNPPYTLYYMYKYCQSSAIHGGGGGGGGGERERERGGICQTVKKQVSFINSIESWGSHIGL